MEDHEPLERRGRRLEGPPPMEREELVFDPHHPPHLKKKFMASYHVAKHELTPRQIHDIEVHVGICPKCTEELESERSLF